ncbi:SRPBCC family protein [Actinoplanes sp. G11-F43]|uniref:SRPBCC family protein n=1 Tax=Actinoplanes sp. G11-F43 TaxID=3424130 RepID=UPI003D33D7E1
MHLSAHIDRPVKDVYEYIADPANLPAWAPGLGSTIENVDGRWFVDSAALGRVEVVFAPRNDLGVLDHHVTVASGETFYNPVRVIADGDGSEIIFTVRRANSTVDFDADVRAVQADLDGLKRILEA